MKDFIAQAVNRIDLSEAEAAAAMTRIMEGAATAAQIAAFAVALRMKGETIDEIVGFARVMREFSVIVPTSTDKVLVDTCGTGGDQLNTFNISTTAAIIAAASGKVAVAKHGNRAASSKCGSADVLEALGVNLNLPPAIVGRCVDEVGIGFLYAPAMHPALKFAAAPRREIGTRTFFNVLGPLTNPAGAKRQLIGVFDPELCRLLAQALQRLGSEACLMVHGMDGLDEISTTAETLLVEMRGDKITSRQFNASESGIAGGDLRELSAGQSASENAAILEAVLEGSDRGGKRDIACLNAAGVFVVAGVETAFADAYNYAVELVDSGAAMATLDRLRAFTSGAN